MSRKFNAVIWIVIIFSTLLLYGDVPHDSDPRWKIESIVGEGRFTGQLYQQETTWTIKGGGQDWVFSCSTPNSEKKEDGVRLERFWITILRVDGKWVSRTRYRYREVAAGKGWTELTEKDKGGKFNAKCRITEKKIVLAAITKKKHAYIFRVTKKDSLLIVNRVSLHDLSDWVVSYKKSVLN